MQSRIKIVGALMLWTVGASASRAAPKTTPLNPTMYCENIASACEAAGYKKNGHKPGEGMWTSCMQPLLNGTDVANVSVNPTDVAGCLKLRAAKPKTN